MPAVSIVIASFNHGVLLSECVNALLSQSFQDFEIIISDNMSDDESVTALKMPKHVRQDVVILRHKERCSYGKLVNEALRRAKGEWVAVIDPIVAPEDEWLEQLMRATYANPDTKMFASVELSDQEEKSLVRAGYAMHLLGYRTPCAPSGSLNHLRDGIEVFSPTHTAALYQIAVLRDVNGFDEYCHKAFADVDVACKFRLERHQARVVKGARVYYINLAKGPEILPMSVTLQQETRLVLKTFPALLLPLFLPFHLLRQSYEASLAMFRGKGMQGWKGIWFGLLEYTKVTLLRKQLQRRRSIGMVDWLKQWSC